MKMFSDVLHSSRLASRLSSTEAAGVWGVNNPTYSKFESGLITPGFMHICTFFERSKSQYSPKSRLAIIAAWGSDLTDTVLPQDDSHPEDKVILVAVDQELRHLQLRIDNFRRLNSENSLIAVAKALDAVKRINTQLDDMSHGMYS